MRTILELSGAAVIFGSLIVCGAAPTCSDLDGGLCTACTECCADYTAQECEGCVAAECVDVEARAPEHICMDGEVGECNVCDECCNKQFLASQHACDACVSSRCEGPSACGTDPSQCSMESIYEMCFS